MGENARYDYSLTTFSPTGRLLQIEYALIAVRNGQPANAVRAKDGIVLATENHNSVLMESTPKIMKVSKHNGFVYGGVGPDARLIADRARVITCNYELEYSTEIPVKMLVQKVSAFMQRYTQSGGARPFGCSLLVAGWDTSEGKSELYQVDPSGAYFGMKASAIGRNEQRSKTFLENRYNEEIGLEDAAHTSLLALREAFDQPMTRELVEMAYCTADGFKTLSKEKVQLLLADI